MTRSGLMRWIMLGAHVALLVGLLLWTQFSALGVAAVLPLLVPARGLWRGDTYTCGWASMLVTFYCAFLLAETYSHPQGKASAVALAAIAAADFVALILFVRLRAQERRAQTA